MENDYYLHNFQVGDSSGMINRMYQLYTVPDSSSQKPILKFPDGGRHRIGTISSSSIPWWKAALLSHLKQRLWNRLSQPFDEDVLLPRFERMYQPESFGHFDSIISREWETPHRREHSAQHSAVHDDGDAFVRIVSRSSDPPLKMDSSEETSHNECTIRMLDKIESLATPGPKLFSGYFAEQRLNARTSYVGSDFEEESDVKPEYLKYCSQNSRPSAQVYSVEKVDEFKKALLETTMQADDVSGIREVSPRELATSSSMRLTRFCLSQRWPNLPT